MVDLDKEEIKSIDNTMSEEIPPAPEAPQPNFSESDANWTANSNIYEDINTDDNIGKILGIISLVTGILSLLCCCSIYAGAIFSISAIVCGIISIKKSNNYKGLAIAGIVLGGIGVMFTAVGIFFKGILSALKLMGPSFGEW